MGEVGLWFGIIPDFRTPIVAVGLAIDGGVVLSDRVMLLLRLEGSLVPGNLIEFLPGAYVCLGGGPAIDYFVSERFTVGAGVRLLTPSVNWGALSLSLPLRANFFPAPREATAGARTGVILGFQLVPTYIFGSVLGSGLSATFTVGYGMW